MNVNRGACLIFEDLIFLTMYIGIPNSEYLNIAEYIKNDSTITDTVAASIARRERRKSSVWARIKESFSSECTILD